MPTRGSGVIRVFSIKISVVVPGEIASNALRSLLAPEIHELKNAYQVNSTCGRPDDAGSAGAARFSPKWIKKVVAWDRIVYTRRKKVVAELSLRALDTAASVASPSTAEIRREHYLSIAWRREISLITESHLITTFYNITESHKSACT